MLATCTVIKISCLMFTSANYGSMSAFVPEKNNKPLKQATSNNTHMDSSAFNLRIKEMSDIIF